MVKLDELSPEMVDIIVRIGSDPSASPNLRYQDLKSFARISSIFQSPLQRVMSERVSLCKSVAAKAWIECGRKEFVVKELEFHPDDQGAAVGDSDELEAVDMRGAIQVCRPGLEKLVVLTIDELESAILEEPNLKGERAKHLRDVVADRTIPDITSLTLYSYFDTPHAQCTPSFAGVTDLTITLWLIGATGMLDSDVFDTIIRTNRITTLTITHLYNAELQQLTSQIDLIGPHLKTLRIRSGPVFRTPEDKYLRPPPTLLARCAVLETLEISSKYESLRPLLLRLPNLSLRHLNVTAPISHDQAASILALPSLKGLLDLAREI